MEIGDECIYETYPPWLTYGIPVLYIIDPASLFIVNEREKYAFPMRFDSIMNWRVFICGGGHARMCEFLYDWDVWTGID